MRERIEYFKNGKTNEYAQCILKAAEMYKNIYIKVVHLSAEFQGFDATIYEASLKEAQAIA